MTADARTLVRWAIQDIEEDNPWQAYEALLIAKDLIPTRNQRFVTAVVISIAAALFGVIATSLAIDLYHGNNTCPKSVQSYPPPVSEPAPGVIYVHD